MSQAPTPTPPSPPAPAEPGSEWLSQLRDIHAAPDAPFWPPAPGWWLLAAILLAVLGWLGYRLFRQWRVKRRRQALALRLDRLAQAHDPSAEPAEWLAAVNQTLKWVAIRAFPGECEALRGADWAAFLQARSGAGDGAFGPLATGPYQPIPDFDAGALQRAARQWVLANG
ncbi:DUF4381 domain-containing protein [Marinihelvus fidelis]|uniref:DUF4381 domain-containing protein n=1 Tax=Marinihelvus fidelis TaxID=2613842 RepID=A0A5N0TCK4_9GAMM|nr:DUF4381 domain-containing protein [Marinihelvus fidelis]KAA9131009.1 DUF4381 domain-containing protein [Marinihelvus fidelis]